MKTQELKTWIKRTLGEDDGCPSVSVELSDMQLEQAILDSIEWFNAFVGMCRETSVLLRAGVSEYDLSAIVPRVGKVVKAFFSGREDIGVLYPGFLDITGIPYGAGGPMGVGSWGTGYPHTTIVQTLQTLNTAAKIFNSDPSWEYYYDPTPEVPIQLLRVMPVPTSSSTCVVLYMIDPNSIKVEWYDSKYLLYIKKMALAKAKYTLGRKRAKYSSGLPTAGGGDRMLDGDALVMEARDDFSQLEQDILDIQGPVEPMVY